MSKFLPKRSTQTKRGGYTRGVFRKSTTTRKKLKHKRSQEQNLGKVMRKALSKKKEGFY